MKLFKRKNLMGLIYGIFVLLPFCAILSRVIYVQSNKNAYESYSNEIINQKLVLPDGQTIVEDETYIIQYNDNGSTSTSYTRFSYKQININWNEILEVNNDFSQVNTFYLRADGQLYLYYVNNSTRDMTYIYGQANVWGNTLKYIQIVAMPNYNFTTMSNVANANIYTYTFTTSKLDNVFDYSVNKFIDDNNFGKMDFFQWFSTLFLDSNAVNNMYVHFVNWYMNYLLYVSLGYLIFSVLMWFVNFFRGLVEKSTELNL